MPPQDWSRPTSLGSRPRRIPTRSGVMRRRANFPRFAVAIPKTHGFRAPAAGGDDAVHGVASGARILSLDKFPNLGFNSSYPVPTRGAFRDRHDSQGAGCGGRGSVGPDQGSQGARPATMPSSLGRHPRFRACVRGSRSGGRRRLRGADRGGDSPHSRRLLRAGPSRVVLVEIRTALSRADRQTKVPRRRRRQAAAVAGESTKQAEKTTACGTPDVSGAFVVTNSCAFCFAHEAADAPRVRRSARPLIWRGRSVSRKTRAHCAARS